MTEERKAVEPEGLARYMSSTYEPARIERHWAAVSRRIQPMQPPWWRAVRPWALVPAVAAIAFVAGRAIAPATSQAPSTAAEIACEGGGQTTSVPGVGSIQCAGGSLYRVDWAAPRIVVELNRGAVTLDLPPKTGRSWAVVAGAFEVRVIGTRFSVRRDDASVEVQVERGRVEVVARDAPGDPKALEAGESWTSGPPPPAAPAAVSATAQAPEVPRPTTDPVAAASAEAVAAPPTWEQLAKAKKPKDAWNALGPGGFAREMESANAEKLFRLAEVARSSGHLKQAAQAFDALRRRHRGDPRAGIAAFELGRMRQDSFRDPGGAVDALSDAIALGPGAPYREDAQARLVDAHHASGGGAGCIAARDAYLARWPGGAHAATVRTRCKR